MLKRLGRLQTLDLSGCVGVTERGIRLSAQALTSLQSLKLGGTSRVATIQNGAVAAIAGMTSLVHLDLSGSHDISDEGLSLCAIPLYLQVRRVSQCQNAIVLTSGLARS